MPPRRLPRPWASAVAAVPLLAWAHDSLASVYVVRGSSMEPSLQDGDWLVVRKSDGLWRRLFGVSSSPQEPADEEEGDQRRRQAELERTHCHGGARSRFLHKPPLPAVGEVVVYKDPTAYPGRHSVKRVVGLGHQIVMTPRRHHRTGGDDDDEGDYYDQHYRKSPYHMETGAPPETTFRVASPSVPPYSLWLEGDNRANSQDSRNKDHGPVSKKLLVGIAEYRIWPPTRIGRLDESSDLRSDPKPYAYWP